MKVTMLRKIGGFRDGLEWPDKGGVIDVPDHEAADLIRNKYAEETDGADPHADADADAADEPDSDETADADADADAADSDEVPVKRARRPRNS